MKLSRTSQNKIDALAKALVKDKNVQFYKRELEKHVGKLEAALGAANLSQQQSLAADRRAKRTAQSREIEEAHIAIIKRGTTK